MGKHLCKNMSSPSLSTSAPLAMTGYLRSQTLDPSLPSHRIKPGAPAQWGKEGPRLPQGSSARGHALLTHYHLSTAWPKRQSFRSGSTPIYSMDVDFVLALSQPGPLPGGGEGRVSLRMQSLCMQPCSCSLWHLGHLSPKSTAGKPLF